MIIVDKALAERHRTGRPIRVALSGAGFMGRATALQIITAAPGIALVAIANRHIATAQQAYHDAGVEDPLAVTTVEALDEAIEHGRPAVTDDALLLCRAEGIEAVIEITGAIEFGARFAIEAIRHRKHILLMNAELDGTIGPILKRRADAAGVIYTNVDGDQPGVMMNLYRFVRGIGVRPVLCGNIKGLHDPYRNPTTQQEFARRWGQKPHMVASFADGTKISYEQAIVANGTGMRVARRGMFGPTVPTGTPITDAAGWFPHEALLHGPGIVDYVVGASPAPGVFVLGMVDHPIHQHYLEVYKLGPGPLYCFYTPYHLCHFEIPNTIARSVLFGDATLAPLGPPQVDVVATAKIDLRAGEVIDGMGYYMTYGQCENADIAQRERLLPMGLAESCRLTRDIPKDQVLTYADVELPAGRLADQLRAEQDALFAPNLVASA